jgi:hypothetical protein
MKFAWLKKDWPQVYIYKQKIEDHGSNICGPCGMKPAFHEVRGDDHDNVVIHTGKQPSTMTRKLGSLPSMKDSTKISFCLFFSLEKGNVFLLFFTYGSKKNAALARFSTILVRSSKNVSGNEKPFSFLKKWKIFCLFYKRPKRKRHGILVYHSNWLCSQILVSLFFISFWKCAERIFPCMYAFT